MSSTVPSDSPITVTITDGPLAAVTTADSSTTSNVDAVGARLVFEGIVRRDEDGKPLAALDYQTYEPMARHTLAQLASDIVKQFGLSSLAVQHSRGRVPVGGCSLRVVIESAHRGEGLDAMREFIRRLKQDVPIWKSPVWEQT